MQKDTKNNRFYISLLVLQATVKKYLPKLIKAGMNDSKVKFLSWNSRTHKDKIKYDK